jgi:hypothetical protein
MHFCPYPFLKFFYLLCTLSPFFSSHAFFSFSISFSIHSSWPVFLFRIVFIPCSFLLCLRRRFRHPSFQFLQIFTALRGSISFFSFPPTLAFLVVSSHIYFRLPVSVSTFSAFFSSLILFRSFRLFPFIYDHISRILTFLLIPLLFSTQPFCSFFSRPPPLPTLFYFGALMFSLQRLPSGTEAVLFGK